jgi:hypothetical protein
MFEVTKRLTLDIIKKAYVGALQQYNANPNTTIFRYLDFAKFMSLLENKSLYLTRADRFEDPLEGFLPDWYMDRMMIGMSLLLDEKQIMKAREDILSEVDELKKRTFISCWNEAIDESYALWQIYAKKYGVALKTKLYKLEELIKETPAKIFKVKYIDDNSKDIVFPPISNEEQSFSLLRNFFVCKQKHYSYENEIRIILIEENKNETNPIPIDDLSKFIDEIYVSPFAEEWFLDLVRKIVNDRYKLRDTKVIKSKVRLKST